MKITGAVGFAGTVYRAGQEAEFEAAIAAADVKPDLDALVHAGAIEIGKGKAAKPAEPSTSSESDEAAEDAAPKAAKTAKSAKGKKKAK
jgi:hypothetical protein